MEEGEQKGCLVEPKLEKKEEMPLQVQMQLLEAMEGMEALEAVAEQEEAGATVIIEQLLSNQEQLEALVVQEVMEAAAAQEG